MIRRVPPIAIALSLFALALACGGGGKTPGPPVSGPSPTTSTSASTTSTSTATTTSVAPSVTLADLVPTLGAMIAGTINNALVTGSATLAQTHEPLAPGAMLWRLFEPTLHAQVSNFVAPCPTGGTGSIRYFGGRPIVLNNHEVVFSNCSNDFRNGDVTFSGTLLASGRWTATDPGPVHASGPINVNQIGPAQVSCDVTASACVGTISGVVIGPPEPPPLPAVNSCPATLSPSGVSIPAAGGAFTVTVTLANSCRWSVTSSPSFITITVGSAGTGPGGVSFFALANSGAERSATLQVAGQSVVITQAAASTSTTSSSTTTTSSASTTTTSVAPPGPGPADAVGQWSGQLTTTTPCSNNTTTQRVNWNGRVTLNGNTFTIVWTDQYFGTPMTRTFTAAPDFQFTITDGTDTFTLVGHFAADYRSLQGPFTGMIQCGRPQLEQLNGTWNGTRTGP